MARRTKAGSDRAAAEVAVLRLVEAAGVKLIRRGAEMVGTCPFHGDACLALTIDPEANTWTCPTCGTGSAVEWVMKAEGVSRRHALELLAEGLPAKGKLGTGEVKFATIRKLTAPITLDADDRQLLRQVVDYYHSTLKQSPDALQYLEQRGLRSAEAVERFRLGYANRTLGLRLPAKNRRLGAELRGRLTNLGIYRDTGHEHLNGCLVVPVFDAGDNVLQVYGRKTTPNLRPGTALHLYLPGPVRGVWNAEALAATKTVILAKSFIDALTFWCAGYRNVTALLGQDLHDDLLTAMSRTGRRPSCWRSAGTLRGRRRPSPSPPR